MGVEDIDHFIWVVGIVESKCHKSVVEAVLFMMIHIKTVIEVLMAMFSHLQLIHDF